MTGNGRVYAVVRLRGEVRVRGDITDTLRMLRLQKVNHCALVPGRMLGMVHKAKDHVAYGPVDAGVVEALLRSRGRVSGQRKLTDDWVKSYTGFQDIAGLARALASGEVALNKITGLQPLFRLHPARKGLPGRGTKGQVQMGPPTHPVHLGEGGDPPPKGKRGGHGPSGGPKRGAVGNWGERIGELLERMR